MKIWITKYALTQGIIEKEARIVEAIPNMIEASQNEYYHFPDWHLSLDMAILRAHEMKEAKIKSLNKSLNKIKNLSF